MKKWLCLGIISVALVLHILIINPWFKSIVDDPKMKHFGELYGPVSFFYGPYRIAFWIIILILLVVVFRLFRNNA